jgi:hypothetical protein
MRRSDSRRGTDAANDIENSSQRFSMIDTLCLEEKQLMNYQFSL